jgi:hypothetical protein
MKTEAIEFSTFMNGALSSHGSSLSPSIEGLLDMSPMMQGGYIIIISVAVVFIVGSKLSDRWKDGDQDQQRYSEWIDTFLKTTSFVGGFVGVIWFMGKLMLLFA